MALRDLEFDHQIGKIIEEDYLGVKATLLIHAASALEAKEKQDEELIARLEEAIRQRREKQANSHLCSQCGTPLDFSDRFYKTCGQPEETTCPKCGGKLRPTDLYCNKCGASVSTLTEPAPLEGSS